MVGFRNTIGGAPLARAVTDGMGRVAFARGSLGFVAINAEAGAWVAPFETGLPPGSYCDVVAGAGCTSS